MPGAYLYGWEQLTPTTGVWHKLICNNEGKLIIDPSEIFENDPTDNEHGKAPDSDWAHDHETLTNAHHDRYTAVEARAAISNIFGADGKADVHINMDTHYLFSVGFVRLVAYGSIQPWTNESGLYIQGGITRDESSYIQLYGKDHATKPDIIEFYIGGFLRAYFDAAGVFYVYDAVADDYLARYTDAEAEAVADTVVATHTALPTVHQNAPALIAAHAAILISQSKLKTIQGSVQRTRSTGNNTLPGGEYGFYPRLKVSAAGSTDVRIAFDGFRTTSYVTNIGLSCAGTTIYAQQRYVSASGEIFWIFILRAVKDYQTIPEKDELYTIKAGTIISMYQAPDHPCFGNGGKPLLCPHPFGDYDETKHEIIVINPTSKEIQQMTLETQVDDETRPDKDLLEVIMEEYEIDEKSRPEWPTIPITVGLPKDYELKQAGEEIKPVKKVIPQPGYIKVRRLKRRL